MIVITRHGMQVALWNVLQDCSSSWLLFYKRAWHDGKSCPVSLVIMSLAKGQVLLWLKYILRKNQVGTCKKVVTYILKIQVQSMKYISGYQSSKAATSTRVESMLISYSVFHLIIIILIYCSYQILPRKAKAFCLFHKQRTYPHHRIPRSFCFQCYVQANYNLW